MTQRAAAVVVVAAAFVLLSACSGEPRAVQPRLRDADVASPRTIPVHIVSHGWHTGLVIPARALNAVLPDLGTRFGVNSARNIDGVEAHFRGAEDVGL